MSAQQNLVPNGSFEDKLSCPNTVDDFAALKDWDLPTLGTSDYYHPCNQSVPANGYGYEFAHSGDAYVGIVTNTYKTGITYREYIQVQLIQQLDPEVLYKISFYISCADSCLNASNNMGVYFSRTRLSFPNMDDTLTVFGFQSKSEIVTKSVGWEVLDYYYFSNGSENYLIIGNFNSNSNTHYQSIGIDSTRANNTESYYYIDDVIVEKIDFDIPNVFTPNDDGTNDFWRINYLPRNTEIKIYNRWGLIVNEGNVQGNYKWDGTDKKGMKCSDGCYFYIISLDNIKETRKGFIQLIN